MKAIKKVVNNLLICLFLLCASGMYAQTASINWNESVHPCTAADINIGSGQCTDIIIYFEVQDANITGGKVVITLPNLNGETFNLVDFPVEKLGNSVDLGAATVSGSTLTFPLVNLSAGSVVYYCIPRYASAQSNAVYTNEQAVTVDVYSTSTVKATNGTKNDIKYRYKYATLQLLDPLPMPAGQSSGLQMDFDANNGVHSANPTAQEFQFQMLCSGGAVDSATISLQFPIYEVALSEWKVNGILLDNSQITITSTVYAPFTNTCTVKIRKSDFPNGKGIGTGESVPLSVKVLKSGCGTVVVNYTSLWATASAIKALYDVTAIGAFNASPGSGKLPGLKYVSYTSTLPNGMLCKNNSANTNILTYAITNTGEGLARNIQASIEISFSGYLDTANIFVRKNYNGSPEKVKKMTVTAWTPTSTTTNPLYRGLPRLIRADISQTLSSQDTLYIDIPYVSPADYLIYQKGVDNGSYALIPVTCAVPFYTNDSGDKTYSVANPTAYPGGDGASGIVAWDNTLSFLSGEVKKFSVSMRMEMFSRSAMTTGNAKAVFQIALPKGLELENNAAGDISVYNSNSPASVWQVMNFSADLISSPDSNLYVFELHRNGNTFNSYIAYTMDFMLRNTCSVSENRTVTGEIRTKIYPTGVVIPSDCNDVVYDGLQIYPPFTLQCAKEGVTYSFDRKRLTVGWQDYNNDGVPDNTLPPDPSMIDHDYVMPNDTLQYTWTGEVLEAGNNALYAVLLSSINHTRVVPAGDGTPSVLTLNGNSNDIQSVLKNSKTGSIISYDRGTGVPAIERYAYVWEITKTNKASFSANDKIVFSIPVTGAITYEFLGLTTYNASNWFYASKDKLENILSILSPGDARKGKEEYPFSYKYVSPVWSYVSDALSFSSPGAMTTYNTILYLGQVGSNAKAFLPNEYRHLSTADSVVMEVPEGYVIADNINFLIENSGNGLSENVLISASSLHTNLPNRKTFVLGANVFDVNRDTPGKVPLPDAGYYVRPYPLEISATNSSPTGVTQGSIIYYADAHTYTQAYIPRMEKQSDLIDYATTATFNLTYADPGSLKASVSGPAAKEALSSTVSWNINLQNTKSDGDAYSAWLYVQGPVSNAILNIGGADYPGSHDGNRWIKLPAIPKGTTISGTLSVTYSSADCNDQTVNLYPIFDKTQTAQDVWTPASGGITMTDAGFTTAQQGGTGFDYIYSKFALTIRNAASNIGGSITALAATPADPANPTSGTYGSATVAVGSNFPLEVVFSTMGANGPVVNTHAMLTVPAGLEYVANSAYMEIGSTNYPVQPGSSFITELERLTGDAVGKVLNLDLSQTGITALGSNGQLLGTSDTYLRFRLKPTCDISPSSPRITVSFTGDRLCGTAATGSGAQTFSSSPLTLSGIKPSFTVDMTGSVIDMTTFDCDNDAILTLRFKKTSEPSRGVALSDSLLVAVPKAIDLKAGITYNLPEGWNGLTPAQTGQTVAAGTVNNRTEGEYRLITWPMPEAYFNALGAAGEGVQKEDNVYTIPLQFAQSADYFNGNMRVAVITGVTLGTGCQPNSAESGAFTIKAVVKATSTTWQGTVDDDWANDANWSNGVPGTCTDVEMLASATFFPMLTDTTARVNSIHFPFGTEIGGIPYLNYNRATVDLTVTSNRWYLLSSPFMDMYSGDYILGSTRNDPAVYIRRYQSEDLFSGAAKKVASWTSSFGKTNVLLTPGTGYAIWVATDANESRTFDFPKDAMSYDIYNKGGTDVVDTELIPSRANSYRFAFHDKFSQSTGKDNRSFDMAVENGNESGYTNLLIANPFMSHLDFDAFYSENNGKIGNTFYVWNGSSFKATNQAYNEASGDYDSRYIAPQQSFVVLRNGSTTFNDLHFTPAMSVANVGSSLRSTESTRLPRLQLKVYKYGVLQSEAEIRYQPGASNGFEDTSDAWTLFAEDVKKTAVLNSLIDNAAASINTIGSLNEDIPLGIRTSEPGELKFEITGAESFDGNVYLIDVAKGGQAIELGTSTEYAFNNTTGDIIDRFYIRILGTNTGINDETTAHGILIYQENSVLYVKSDLSDPLLSVSLFDSQGRLLLQHTVETPGMASEISCALPILGEERMVAVKVISEKSQTVRKLFIK